MELLKSSKDAGHQCGHGVSQSEPVVRETTIGRPRAPLTLAARQTLIRAARTQGLYRDQRRRVVSRSMYDSFSGLRTA